MLLGETVLRGMMLGFSPFGMLIVALSTASASGLPPALQTDSDLGVVEGFVRLAGGAIVSSTRVENTTDPAVCGRKQSLQDLIVSKDTRGVANAAAVLLDVPRDRASERQPKRVLLDNRDCRFEPHVTVITVGDTIVAANSDPTLHTTHYYGVLRGNVSLPSRGMTVPRVAPFPGTVTVLCDIHGWMKAYIRVNEHPYHTVSDREGYFRIPGVPPGKYTLELWHETLGTQHVSVQIRAGITSRIEIEYPVQPLELP